MIDVIFALSKQRSEHADEIFPLSKNDDAILEQTCLKTNLLIPLVKRK